MQVGDHVLIIFMNWTGRIESIRNNMSGQDIYTVRLDVPCLTQDGVFYSRSFEIQPINRELA
jgi:hypothetical protein